MKQIKNAPLKDNFKDIFKSAFYLVASLIAFTLKLAKAIIVATWAMFKTFAQAISN